MPCGNKTIPGTSAQNIIDFHHALGRLETSIDRRQLQETLHDALVRLCSTCNQHLRTRLDVTRSMIGGDEQLAVIEERQPC